VLHRIHDFELLTRQQIQRLEFTPTTTSTCKRRLTLLYHNGYIGRVALPIRNSYGAARAIYILERPGLRALIHSGLIETCPGWGRFREPGELFLHHRIAIADVRVAFTRAADARRYTLTWWDERELRRRRTFDWRPQQDAVHLLPDGFFMLSTESAADGFAVEVDRATVAMEKMRARYLAYAHFASRAGSHGALPCASFRVLTVVAAPDRRDRLAQLKRACEDIGGRSLFWFLDLAQWADGDVLGEACWAVAGDDCMRRLPLSTG
jgi:hypothetical protein